MLPHLSYLLPLFPSRVLLISVIALFIIDWLFFISSRSLLNISCIFSIVFSTLFSITPVCFQDFGSSLLSLFWTLFQVHFLSPPLLFGLVGLYHVPLPAKYFCLFILFRLLCLGWPFCRLEVCSSSWLWRLLPVGGVGLVAYQGFLVGKFAYVFWWVELDLFSLEWSELSSSEFWGVYGCGVTLGSLYFNA